MLQKILYFHLWDCYLENQDAYLPFQAFLVYVPEEITAKIVYFSSNRAIFSKNKNFDDETNLHYFNLFKERLYNYDSLVSCYTYCDSLTDFARSEFGIEVNKYNYVEFLAKAFNRDLNFTVCEVIDYNGRVTDAKMKRKKVRYIGMKELHILTREINEGFVRVVLPKTPYANYFGMEHIRMYG